MKRAVVGKCEK